MGDNLKINEIIDINENLHKLKIDELKIGMILGETINVSEKKILLKNDTITNEILEMLQNKETLEEVCVYKTKKYYNSDFENPENESVENKDYISGYNDKIKINVADTVAILEKTFDSISANLNQIFYKLGMLKGSNIDEIRTISKQLQEKMTDLNALINAIVFHGSGKDSIYRHGINVAVLSNLLGKWVGLDEKKVNLLTYSGLLHDIGKTKIDSKIFTTNDLLSEEDFNIVKSHPLLGYNIVKEINFLDKSVAQGILMHHERLDGSGYPLGLQDDNISQFGKIIAIADVFDAINSNRSYRKKKAPFEALEIIKKESFGKLDYKYSNIFLHHMFSYYVGKDVVLNNNKVAQIIQMDINDLDRPLILLEDSFIKLSLNSDLEIVEFVL
ncbi:HD family phosphohydrolase [Clostridium gelidum]|uniref:HD family phosphohydrolase n=1 Tax=Clostridium gelidum TaxID=704125 RepID=A0ABM7T710_9CLOT|nr:HD-GYP domain-containing protein [Clostridium gelidum]BCZ46757.1 HD family phosphohydrolase [Clostridium gelidum]